MPWIDIGLENKTGHDLHINYVDGYKNMSVIWTLS